MSGPAGSPVVEQAVISSGGALAQPSKLPGAQLPTQPDGHGPGQPASSGQPDGTIQPKADATLRAAVAVRAAPNSERDLPGALQHAARMCGLEGILLSLPPAPSQEPRKSAGGKENDVSGGCPSLALLTTPAQSPGRASARTPLAMHVTPMGENSLSMWPKLDVTERAAYHSSASMQSARRASKRSQPTGSSTAVAGFGSSHRAQDGSDSRGRRAVTEQKKRRRAGRSGGVEEQSAEHLECEEMYTAASLDLFGD